MCMDGGFNGPRSSDNVELQSGGGPSKKARKSNEFVSESNLEWVDESNRTDACDVKPSPVVGQGSAAVSTGVRADVGLGGYSFKQMVFIELCAGSANLSSVAQKYGYCVMPVDHKRNRHQPKCHIVELDLTTDHAWEVLGYIVQTCDVAAIHLAPPCGTCSKARGIPLPKGEPGPPVLRTDEFPLGVEDMSDADRIKVNAANELYKRMGPFLQWLSDHRIAWVLENPTNSLVAT